MLPDWYKVRGCIAWINKVNVCSIGGFFQNSVLLLHNDRALYRSPIKYVQIGETSGVSCCAIK